mmetsp:Transcript_28356/g.40624  ORF Transcript_28356/g.40624 Transcript_28356/m.40624 type:complete len:87 (+) Transcript_28356:2862-3122(+)
MFLEGLEHDPQFKPAIKRARCLLDNKNKKDPTVPPALYLAVLPNTIERYRSPQQPRYNNIMRNMPDGGPHQRHLFPLCKMPSVPRG